jgi:hypothetical protein
MSATTVTSTAAPLTNMPNSVDLPPPAAAKIPMRCPSPQVNIVSMTRKPSGNGSLMMRPVMISEVDPWASVDEFAPEPGGLVVFPNPASDVVRFAMEADMPMNGSIECIDATGRSVWSERLSGTNTFSTASIANGLYILRVLNAQGIVQAQGRMVVQH